MRRQLDDQFGLLFRCQGGGMGARPNQAGMEIGVRLRQFGQEGGVQPLHACAMVQLIEGEAEAERELVPDTGHYRFL